MSFRVDCYDWWRLRRQENNNNWSNLQIIYGDRTKLQGCQGLVEFTLILAVATSWLPGRTGWICHCPLIQDLCFLWRLGTAEFWDSRIDSWNNSDMRNTQQLETCPCSLACPHPQTGWSFSVWNKRRTLFNKFLCTFTWSLLSLTELYGVFLSSKYFNYHSW